MLETIILTISNKKTDFHPFSKSIKAPGLVGIVGYVHGTRSPGPAHPDMGSGSVEAATVAAGRRSVVSRVSSCPCSHLHCYGGVNNGQDHPQEH